ncbi:MAG: cytochrome c biogenesis protein CcsA [Gemmatimonadota bacterium]|uniref:Cytochrome c assembly protein domain-containing protein n=1 Tax=marine metagenome TaxID=408172 RepID=A0A381VZJ8_9ZZZZ|nr:cytochrome c biogenesis protein CcsA [Gemmatimonadota bacterium]
MTHVVALLLYIGSLILWFRSLFTGGRGTAIAFGLASAGVLVHIVALARFTADYRQLPFEGLGPSLSTLALIIGVGLIATIGLGEGRRVGIVLVPVVIVLEAVAVSLGLRPSSQALDFQGAWFGLHVALAFVGLGGFAVAFASGILYLVQLHELNLKRMGRLFRFTPPLTTLDRLVRVALVTGFTTFTLALSLGWLWTISFRQSFDQSNPKVLWSLMIWAIFVVALVVRVGGGLKERRSAVASAIGFPVIVIVYLGLRMVSSAHGFFL